MCAALVRAGYAVTATDKRPGRKSAALLWFGQAVATAEALLLGQRAGIDPAALQHALAGSSAASTLIRNDIGLVFGGDYLASFGLDRICEELDAVTALAGEHQGAVGALRGCHPHLPPCSGPLRAR